MATLAPGDAAPDFALPDRHGRTHRLADYRGQWVLLYFYPRDETPDCTTQACTLRDAVPEFKAADALVLGISRDGAAAHARFADKYDLNFPLLSDIDGAVAARYGALWAVGPVKIVRRHSFLIDPQGRIARIYRSVDPQHHAARVLEDLKERR